ncbi:non-canonical purine NTP pyrophosphatase [Candidatus Hodarchaeum mangrovi]
MENLPNSIEIGFVSSNVQKYKEIYKVFLQKSKIQLKFLNMILSEIQSDSLEEIAKFSLKTCFQKDFTIPYFVEDSGLFIETLNGFPGPYSSYVLKTIGLWGILKLLEEKDNRKAFFQSSIALYFNKKIYLFTGRVNGIISASVSKSGWGYDPIFIPSKGDGKTFGELGEKKYSLSHRYLAVCKLISFLNEEYKLGS